MKDFHLVFNNNIKCQLKWLNHDWYKHSYFQCSAPSGPSANKVQRRDSTSKANLTKKHLHSPVNDHVTRTSQRPLRYPWQPSQRFLPEKSVPSTNCNNNQTVSTTLCHYLLQPQHQSFYSFITYFTAVVLQHACICDISSKFRTTCLLDLLLRKKLIQCSRACKRASF